MQRRMTFSQSVFTVAIVLLLSAGGCATTGLSLPASVHDVNPVDDCESLSSPRAWNIKAKMIEADNVHYLIVSFKPPFKVTQPPKVSFNTGFVIYEGNEGDLYYYKIEKFTKNVWLGTISFETNEVKRHLRGTYETMRMQQIEGSECIRLL